MNSNEDFKIVDGDGSRKNSCKGKGQFDYKCFKKNITWTQELHDKILDALNSLGEESMYNVPIYIHLTYIY